MFKFSQKSPTNKVGHESILTLIVTTYKVRLKFYSQSVNSIKQSHLCKEYVSPFSLHITRA